MNIYIVVLIYCFLRQSVISTIQQNNTMQIRSSTIANLTSFFFCYCCSSYHITYIIKLFSTQQTLFTQKKNKQNKKVNKKVNSKQIRTLNTKKKCGNFRKFQAENTKMRSTNKNSRWLFENLIHLIIIFGINMYALKWHRLSWIWYERKRNKK